MVRFFNIITDVYLCYKYIADPSKIFDDAFNFPKIIDPTDSECFFIDFSKSETI